MAPFINIWIELLTSFSITRHIMTSLQIKVDLVCYGNLMASKVSLIYSVRSDLGGKRSYQ